MSVFIARFGVDLYTVPLWELASGRHHVLVKATDRNLAWMWVEARDALGGPAECRPPYRSVCYLRKLLTIEEWGVDCFAIQPMAGRAAAPDLREPDCIAVNLAGAIYDGNFGWIGRVEQWTGLCTARELVKGLVVLLQTDQDALYGPEGCDIPWDYAAATLGGYASGWLGRQR